MKANGTIVYATPFKSRRLNEGCETECGKRITFMLYVMFYLKLRLYLAGGVVGTCPWAGELQGSAW